MIYLEDVQVLVQTYPRAHVVGELFVCTKVGSLALQFRMRDTQVRSSHSSVRGSVRTHGKCNPAGAAQDPMVAVA